MWWAKGYLTKSGWYCTLMGPPTGPILRQPCFKARHFSNPRKIYKSEVLGEDWRFDNARWIKENRFLLSNVDNETLSCQSNGFGHWVQYLFDADKIIEIDHYAIIL